VGRTYSGALLRNPAGFGAKFTMSRYIMVLLVEPDELKHFVPVQMW